MIAPRAAPLLLLPREAFRPLYTRVPETDARIMSHTRARADDSVPLDEFSDGDSDSGRKEPRLRVANLKLLVALFIMFIVVVSDVFTNSIIAGFGEKAVRCRTPTSWGTVLQGIFLVIFYIFAVYLTEHQIL